VRISQLEGKRLALWGWGREGRAAHAALRTRLPRQALTLFCDAGEALEAAALGDFLLTTETRVDAGRLAGFDVVIKSPGISPYRPEALAAAAAGARFIGGTALWFAEHAQARTLCVTGTKGKSTTTALLAHLLRAGGHRTALAGNIGLPLLELLDPQPEPEFWAVELSSYQARDVAASGAQPEIAAVLNLYPEHLDWHGSESRYIDDKLALVTEAGPRTAVLNAADPVLAQLQLPHGRIRWFNREDGWHLRGDVLYRADDAVLDTAPLPLPGRHNRINLCAVAAIVEAAGLPAATLLPAAMAFTPLPHRLQRLGERDGLIYIDDSISTTPHASLAALEMFSGLPVAILVGGYDRGLDWSVFAQRLAGMAPAAVVTMGAHGDRIHALLEPVAAEAGVALTAAQDLPQAMERAAQVLRQRGGGVLLLSPGAPSFGAYRDYAERGRHFAILAGFDPDAISSIQHLGIL
jgi:UDP-N-acetylmuramoylalanine--D-glutamate ligase